MAFNPISGVNGSVLVASVSYAFGKWRADLKTNLPKVNNFTSAYQLLVAGLTSATITVEGPYDGGNMPVTTGTSYALTLKYNNAITLTVTALCESINPSQDIEDAARITVTFQSNGSFTSAVT